MVTLIDFKGIAIAVVFVSALLGAYIPWYLRRREEFGGDNVNARKFLARGNMFSGEELERFSVFLRYLISGGVLLAVGIVHLLPDASDVLDGLWGVPLGHIMCGGT
jgi:hypothetical protein